MAGTTPTPTPPLRLKDLLELDCDSCSAAGFRCYPRRLACDSSAAPMRHLLESSPSLSLRRRPSKLSHLLSRSLSRRLSRRGGFWSRRRDEDEDDDAAAAVAATATAASAGCGGGSRSSSDELESSTSSESSDDNSSGRTSRRSRSESDSDFSSAAAATEDSVHHHPSQPAGAGDEHEVAMKRVSKEGSSSESEAEDKEQHSPVAVMDFPFDDDDDDDGEVVVESTDAAIACAPSFSLARLQRRTTHKIRRFETHDELAPLDLEARLVATTSDPDVPAAAAAIPPQQQMVQRRTGDATTSTPTSPGSGHHGGAGAVYDVPDEDDDDLISLLVDTVVSAGLDDVSERLLLDFFEEMKRRRSEAHAAEAELALTGPPAAGVLRRKVERLVDGEAVAAAARGWLEGTGTERRWGLTDVLSGGADVVAEMERGRRWMQVGEEEREVGAVVAGMLLDQLVVEAVLCLFM